MGVELGGVLVIGLVHQAVFFVFVDVGIIVLASRVHVVEEVDVGGPVGGVGMYKIGDAVFVDMKVYVLEDIGDVFAEEHDISV